jgi:hypothetical protein
MDLGKVQIPGNSDPNQPNGQTSHLAIDIGGYPLTQSLFNSHEFLLLLFSVIKILMIRSYTKYIDACI